MFGTLLGIVRDNSCIEGDDDIDIMINYDYYSLRKLFEKRGFTFTNKYGIPTPSTILKSEPTEKFGSFDFYLCSVDGEDYYNPWHRVVSSNSFPLIKKEWRSTVLNFPNAYLDKIIAMYGDDWKTPQSKSCKTGIYV